MPLRASHLIALLLLAAATWASGAELVAYLRASSLRSGVPVPLPPRFGGGLAVTSAAAAVASRINLAPQDVAELAQARQGTLPEDVAQRLEDAYARGEELGKRLGLSPGSDRFLGNRFANYLVRWDREGRRLPPSASLDDARQAVLRDTLEDLERNQSKRVAAAAEEELRGLEPLPVARREARAPAQ